MGTVGGPGHRKSIKRLYDPATATKEERMERYGYDILTETPPLVTMDTNELTGSTKLEFAQPSKAPDLLRAAADIMVERGKNYDSPEGERSMDRVVRAFNAITGADMTEAQGWLFMQVLKDVRQWQAKGYHQDSAEDGIAYAALKAECLANGGTK
jgi:hypothetical protein